MLKINNLSGLSGCYVELYKDKESYVVKKTSASVDYNSRLHFQIKKQKEFNSNSFFKPNIILDGFDELGRYYVIMQYVNGINFYDYVDSNSFTQSKKILTSLVNNIVDDFSNLKDSDVLVIEEKIKSLKSKIHGFDDIFEYLIDNIPTKLPINNTHGDLTFENIIIEEDQSIYLIDFLDSFVETPYIDLAKLNQEFDLLWSIRNKEITNNLIIKYNYLKEIYLALIETDKIDKKILDFFSIINLLRILPYVGESDKQLVTKKLNEWKEKLQ